MENNQQSAENFTGVAEKVYEVVKSIPNGSVMSYGQVAGEIVPPVSPRTVGRLMAFCPNNVPWWRVIGADGTLLIAKRSPELGVLQKQLLSAENVPFLPDGRVDFNTLSKAST